MKGSVVGLTDGDLLAAAAGGDRDAYAAFFQRRVRALTGYAVRRCDNPDDVADLVAETFFVGLQASGRYRPETETALPWLFGIARRLLARQRRRRAGQQRLAVKTANTNPRYTEPEDEAIAGAIDAARQAPHIEAALAQLARGEREVLELVAYDGLTPTEAAVVLDVTPNAARLRLSRARRHMRSLLEPAGVVSPDLDAEVGHAF